MACWSRNPIRMKAKDESSRGPDGPDQGVTPRYITKKSPRNVGMAPFKTSLTNISCFQWDLFLDHTGCDPLRRERPGSSVPARGRSGRKKPQVQQLRAWKAF